MAVSVPICISARLSQVLCGILILLAVGDQVWPASPANVVEPSQLLTPAAGPQPQINGPRLFGVRPGKPFLYRIPCTGTRPISFEVLDLPMGWKRDSHEGIITGTAPTQPGDYRMTFKASNSFGMATKEFTLVVGDTLALTPPMGWNSWYIHYTHVTQEHMELAAQTMIESGMADYGYMYVNIDDCWSVKKDQPPYRDEAGDILTNGKFPDIVGMVEKIHSRGLRTGTYTSPGPWTCTRYAGSYGHELADARRFAEWGFDFLKYDWCTYNTIATDKSTVELQRPYILMGREILPTLERDVVFNLCQYGMGNVWEWGKQVGGHCWRTTGDLGAQPKDKNKNLPGFYAIGLANAAHDQFAGPGAWNDPDYLLIGTVGDGKGGQKPCGLTLDEKYSYMSMWCLMAAPLFYSGGMDQLDAGTLNVLCNSEVIAIDQDPLGMQAKLVRSTDDELVFVKPLEDGGVAVGLFNLTGETRSISIAQQDTCAARGSEVRDLWRQQGLGVLGESLDAEVPAHGVALVRIFAKHVDR